MNEIFQNLTVILVVCLMGDMLLRQVMEITLGAEAVGVDEIPVGSETCRQSYAIWAGDAAAAKELVGSDREAVLLSWRGGKPIIKRTSDGLSIELRGVRLKKHDEILALAGLGLTFLTRLKT